MNIEIVKHEINADLNVLKVIHDGDGGKLYKEISQSDIVNGRVEIGTIPNGKKVDMVIIESSGILNSDLTIGTEDAQGLLAVISGSELNENNIYEFNPFVSTGELIKAFLTNGNLKISIYYR